MAVLRSESELETFDSLVAETRKAILAEYELHKKLLENAEFKQQAIIDRDLEKLQDLTRWDEAILEEIAKWEDYMEKAVKGLAFLWRVNSADLNMSRLVELLANEPEILSSQIEEIKKEQEQLQKTLLTLKEVNDKNTLLLRRSLAVVNYSLDVILGRKSESSVYDEKGRRQEDIKKRLFDTQV